MNKATKITKYVLQIVILILVFAFLLAQISYAFRPTVEEWNQEKNNFLGYKGVEKNTIDVLNLGGSETFTYLIPDESYELFGYTSYNYGMTGLRPTVYATLLEEALKTQSPQLVVIGLRPFATDSNAVEDGYFRWVSDMLPYSYTRFKMVKDSIPYIVDVDGNPVAESSSFYFDIIKYHDSYENLSVENWKINSGRVIPENKKGYYISTDVKAINLPDHANITESQQVPKMAEEGLTKLLEVLKKNNLKALFVVTPCEMGEAMAERVNYVSKIVQDAGFDFLDCTKHFADIGMDGNTDFYNEGHVNIKGALKVTKYLGEYITSHYDITKSSVTWDTSTWDELKKKSLEEMK